MHEGAGSKNCGNVSCSCSYLRCCSSSRLAPLAEKTEITICTDLASLKYKNTVKNNEKLTELLFVLLYVSLVFVASFGFFFASSSSWWNLPLFPFLLKPNFNHTAFYLFIVSEQLLPSVNSSNLLHHTAERLYKGNKD